MNYKIAQNLSWRTLGEHTIILDTVTNKQIHHINETASDIWSQLVEEKSKQEILNFMAENYEVATIELEKDFEEFIQDLLSLKIVEELE